MPDFKIPKYDIYMQFKFTVDNNFVLTVFELNAISEFKISARMCVWTSMFSVQSKSKDFLCVHSLQCV